MAALVRIDAGGTHGFQARIGPQTGYRSKLFSDRKWGGKRKAKDAALEWIESQGERYAPKRFGPKKGIQINNMSGTPGVHESKLTRNGNEHRYWAAHYSIGPDGKRTHRSRRFYFGTKRTSEEARALAEEFRSRWVAAFEENGTDGVKEFFKKWNAEHPSPQRGGTKGKGKNGSKTSAATKRKSPTKSTKSKSTKAKK